MRRRDRLSWGEFRRVANFRQAKKQQKDQCPKISSLMQTNELITPYGGRLIDLNVNREQREELMAHAGKLPRIQLSARSLCDLEILATGGFSPLDRFMSE